MSEKEKIWTEEEKKNFLENALQDIYGIDIIGLTNNEKIKQTLSDIWYLSETHGNFAEIKESYFKREKSERLAYLISVIDLYVKTYEELNKNGLFEYIENSIKKVELHEIEKISEPDFCGIPLSVQLEKEYLRPIKIFCSNLVKLHKFFKVENKTMSITNKKPQPQNNNAELLRALNENTKALKDQKIQRKEEMLTMSQLQEPPGKTEKPKDTRPLHEKIHWQKDKTLLRKHLEGLKAAGYITYNKKIDDVISGIETPRTVKCESEDRLILYIFTLWQERGFLKDKTIYKDEKKTGQDDKNYIYKKWSYSIIKKSFLPNGRGCFIDLAKAATPDRKGFTKNPDGTFEYRDTDLHAALSEILK
ncbi:MAG TPA: hypothetical protein PKX12_13625 [Spirochaetota bacterium]|nr:hypothetical protein [Spirochaetota bacterium]